MNIVELHQVTKQYQQVNALQSLDLNIKQGEILGLFGHNGAGKTTIIKLILGLIEATSGDVKVFGENPCHDKAQMIKRKIGFLQENVSFYDQLTGLEVINYFAKLKGAEKSRSLELLAQVGLQDACKRRVKTYSKGMRQRLGLAQALLGHPKLLLLDEPTVGLDPIATHDFYLSIDALKQQGCTVILCSHVLPGVEKYIDRALIMGNGNLLASGSLAELRMQANLSAVFKLQGDALDIPNYIDTDQVQVNNSAGLYQLNVSMDKKMDLIKHLAAQDNLVNMDISLPTLEDVYTHIIKKQMLSEAF